jgi:hypothetical protein
VPTTCRDKGERGSRCVMTLTYSIFELAIPYLILQLQGLDLRQCDMSTYRYNTTQIQDKISGTEPGQANSKRNSLPERKQAHRPQTSETNFTQHNLNIVFVDKAILASRMKSRSDTAIPQTSKLTIPFRLPRAPSNPPRRPQIHSPRRTIASLGSEPQNHSSRA